MVYKTILLALSIIITINSTYGYMDEYGMGYERRGEVGKEELEAKLYKQLEDNYGQNDILYDAYGDLGREYERLMRSYYPDPAMSFEEEQVSDKLVDKSKISETIEEDQELRRNNKSNKNKHDSMGQHNTVSLQQKALESISHGSSNKLKSGQKVSDKSLPFYCHPPNPCPKGFTAKDGCLEFVEDTAEYQKEWISQSQRKGLCQCDEEHMFDCNTNGSGGGGDSGGGAGSDINNGGAVGVGMNGWGQKGGIGEVESLELEKVLERMAKEHLEENPFTKGGHKRQSLVAKKLPRFKREVRYNKLEEELSKMKRAKKTNPYLQGNHLHTVAKKG